MGDGRAGVARRPAVLASARASWGLLLLTIFAAAIRLPRLGADWFNLQEVTYYDESIVVGFLDVFTSHGALIQAHMPLWRLLGWGLQWLSASPAALRGLSVFFGVLCVPTLYFLARRFTSHRWALAAGLLLAVNPMHVLYSRDYTPYTASVFLALWSLVLLVGWFRDGRRWLVPFVVVSGLVVNFHFSFVSHLAGLGVVLLLKGWIADREKPRPNPLPAFIGMAVMILPAILLFFVALQHDNLVTDHWQEIRAYTPTAHLPIVTFGIDTLDAFRAVLGPSVGGEAGMLITGVLLGALLLGASRFEKSRRCLYFCAPFIVTHLLAMWLFFYQFPSQRSGSNFSMFLVRHYLPLAPLMCLVVVATLEAGAAAWRPGRPVAWVLLAALVLLQGRRVPALLTELQRPDTPAAVEVLRAEVEDRDAILALPAFYFQLMVGLGLSESDPPRTWDFRKMPLWPVTRSDGRRVRVASGVTRVSGEPVEDTHNAFFRHLWVLHYREHTLDYPDLFRAEEAVAVIAELDRRHRRLDSWSFHDLDLYRYEVTPPKSPCPELPCVLPLDRSAAPYVHGLFSGPLGLEATLAVKAGMRGEVRVPLEQATGPLRARLRVSVASGGQVLLVGQGSERLARVALSGGESTIPLTLAPTCTERGCSVELWMDNVMDEDRLEEREPALVVLGDLRMDPPR